MTQDLTNEAIGVALRDAYKEVREVNQWVEFMVLHLELVHGCEHTDQVREVFNMETDSEYEARMVAKGDAIADRWYNENGG